jgi:hypothetical protein
MNFEASVKLIIVTTGDYATAGMEGSHAILWLTGVSGKLLLPGK